MTVLREISVPRKLPGTVAQPQFHSLSFCVSRESDPVGFLEIGKSCCNFHNVGFQCGCACILDVVLISMISLCRFMICAKYTTPESDKFWSVNFLNSTDYC